MTAVVLVVVACRATSAVSMYSHLLLLGCCRHTGGDRVGGEGSPRAPVKQRVEDRRQVPPVRRGDAWTLIAELYDPVLTSAHVANTAPLAESRLVAVGPVSLLRGQDVRH